MPTPTIVLERSRSSEHSTAGVPARAAARRMACTFFVNNGPITGRLRHHDAGYRPEAEARHRRGRAAAQRERRRVRCVADRVAPAREDAGFEVAGRFTQKRAGFEAGAYFGTGKREELRLMREQEAGGVLPLDHQISP